jgi:hypothetical protein
VNCKKELIEVLLMGQRRHEAGATTFQSGKLELDNDVVIRLRASKPLHMRLDSRVSAIHKTLPSIESCKGPRASKEARLFPETEQYSLKSMSSDEIQHTDISSVQSNHRHKSVSRINPCCLSFSRFLLTKGTY